jgi:hypothetical protein
LPSSPGATPDDVRMERWGKFLGYPVVLMEKMDGANVCLTNEQVFARSHSGPATGRQFNELKAYHANVRHLIPEGYSIFAEWCYAVHSIEYVGDEFPRLFIIGARHDERGTWTDWQYLYQWAGRLNCAVAPLMQVGVFDTGDELRDRVIYYASTRSHWGPRVEGVVVRPLQAFDNEFFATLVGKHVNAEFKAGEKLSASDPLWQPGKLPVTGVLPV